MKRIFRKRKTVIALIATALILLALIVICAIYVSDYYRAKDDEIEAFTPKMTTEIYKKDHISIGDEKSEIGFVFYPGGKVDHLSYLPLMRDLARRGIFCVLYDMPFNLAVFGANSASEIAEEYPDVGQWYIGGHSLGGSMAASCLSKNPTVFKGLVLLGSYSATDISSLDIRVLSVYGSEDGVMNRDKYEENKKNIPKDFTETVIEGASHAYFGMYGEQDGDGEARISAEQQITITSGVIFDFLKSNA